MVALLLILLATDGERRPTHVSFTAPEGCPLIDRYRSELTFRSDRIELVGDEASATAHVVVTITKARRFEGLLVVKTSNGKSVTKRVAGPKCESVTAALSLAAALVLDPEAKAGALPETLPAPTPVPEPAPEPPPAAVEAPPVAETPPPVLVERGEPASPPPPPLRFALHAAADLATTVTGSADPSFGLSANLAVPAGVLLLSARLTGTGGLGREISNTNGTVLYRSHFTGQLELGPAMEFGRVRPELTVGLRAVGAQLSGRGADEVSSSTRVLFEVGPRARVVVSLAEWELAGAGGVSASLTRERYLFQPQGVVFSVPAFAAWGQLSVGRRFQ